MPSVAKDSMIGITLFIVGLSRIFRTKYNTPSIYIYICKQICVCVCINIVPKWTNNGVAYNVVEKGS